jgi:preprotein translocase subunit SecB
MDKTKQPGILFDDIILKELVFSRKEGYANKPALNMQFRASVGISPEKDRLLYEMTCEVNDESEFFKIKCVMIGFFSVIKGKENLELEEFAKVSAPSLLFPYIRETISSTTTKAGIPPVVIPPVNLTMLSHGPVTISIEQSIKIYP